VAGFDGGAVQGYTYGVSLLFWLLSAGLMWWLAHRVGALEFWMTSAATLLNPILLIYVPFALQEGVLMVCCLPLLFVWAGAKDLDPSRRATLVMMLALLAYIIRSSLVWWLPLAAIYAGWLMWPQIRYPRGWLPWMVAVVFTGCLLVGPQIYISKHKSGSFNLSVDHAACPADCLGHYVAQVRDGRRRRALARRHVLVAVPGGARRGQDRRLLSQAPDARRVPDAGPCVCRLSL
jgi:hypothetical protein